MMTKPRPPKAPDHRRRYISNRSRHIQGPKPCPTCYNPMLWVNDHFECAKHGIPTRP